MQSGYFLGFSACMRGIIYILFLMQSVLTYAGHYTDHTLKAAGYSILYHHNDTLSYKWSEYLFNHLASRAQCEGIVRWQEEGEGFRKIYIQVDETLGNDYCIERTIPEIIELKARDESTIFWLIYQFIKQVADEDNRFVAADLPPSIIQWQNRYTDFDFIYREPHYRSNMLQSGYGAMIGAHSVDRDWGIWGHNLGKILHRDRPFSVYAKRGNKVDTTQYCFAGDEIFKQLEGWISENFVENDAYPIKFMIMPNDNNVVCTCLRCRAAGNTNVNATPAVSLLIKRLAERFPRHIFFTTAYRTTIHPPKRKWPVNTGVMISTAELPKGVALEPEDEDVKKFAGLLSSWETRVTCVYLWDYAANFDDYLTPLPSLYGLKKQLQFFKKYGVSGIFLNANSYDYSSFDDMKTFVSSALMMNVELPVDSLCRSYLKQYYPVSWQVIAQYYLSLEKSIELSGKSYPMYGSFDMATHTYFNPETFLPFYHSLGAMMSVAGCEERAKLQPLYAALSFTRLQIAYQQGAKPNGFAIAQGKSMAINLDIKPVWEHLSQYCNDSASILYHYKEKDGDLKQYLYQWEKVFNEAPFSNLLIGEKLIPASEDYPNADQLNDGILGFDSDYQQGWHLCYADNLVIGFDVKNVRNAEKITMRFLDDREHNICPPLKIEICRDGTRCLVLKPGSKNWNSTSSFTTVSAPVDFKNVKSNITLKVYRNKALQKSSLACDEICLQ